MVGNVKFGAIKNRTLFKGALGSSLLFSTFLFQIL
jgi:hypothetical protein